MMCASWFSYVYVVVTADGLAVDNSVKVLILIKLALIFYSPSYYNRDFHETVF
jgi:hypothetical protein